MAVVLVGGGARSGKSRFALDYIRKRRSSGVFIATGEARDDEMHERIRRHRAERGDFWTTLEEPLELTSAITDQDTDNKSVLVDCLTLWLSNVLLDPARDEEAEIDRLQQAIADWRGGDLVLVTNEVGCGIVPDNALARRFRDLAGRLNQSLAATADQVYWMVFGVALAIKPGGRT